MFTFHNMNTLAFESCSESLSEAKALLNFPLQSGSVSFKLKELLLCDDSYPQEAV